MAIIRRGRRVVFPDTFENKKDTPVLNAALEELYSIADQTSVVITIPPAAATNNLNEVTFTVPGALSVTAFLQRWYPPFACTLQEVRASVGVAPTGASIKVDVNKNGTTIFTTQSNRPEIAISGFTDLADAVEVTAMTVGDYLTVDVDQVGSTIAGSDLTVTIKYLVAP